MSAGIERIALERSASAPEGINHAFDKVTLNVGGTIFQTRRDTLSNHEPNYFTRALQQVRGPPTLFIDRDPVVFKWILNYLRGYDVRPLIESLSESETQQLLDDATHFDLAALQKLIVQS